MLGWFRIFRRDGSVLRSEGLQATAELIVDGLVRSDDRIGSRLAGDITALKWAFALSADCDSPYDSYELSIEAD
jgi:hypothetical protein